MAKSKLNIDKLRDDLISSGNLLIDELDKAIKEIERLKDHINLLRSACEVVISGDPEHSGVIKCAHALGVTKGFVQVTYPK